MRSKGFTGRNHSEISKRKMSLSRKGRSVWNKGLRGIKTRTSISVEIRFWDLITKNKVGCWIWGRKATANRRHRNICVGKGSMRVHRFSWEFYYGPVPNGLFVLHSCDNKACVNPNHLFLGTQKDNVHDMMRKGRDPFRRSYPGLKGELSGKAKLSEKKVIEIRKLYSEGCSVLKLSKIFGTSGSNIVHIVKRHTWRHI